MPKAINFLVFSRQEFVDLVADLTPEQMNKIPQGFNNNLIWNLAHVVAVQQAVCYRRAGLPPLVDGALIDAYQRGTFPGEPLSADAIAQIKQLAVSTAVDLERDLEKGLFMGFNSFTVTSKQFSLDTIDDALEFLLYHDGMHLGIAKAMKKLV